MHPQGTDWMANVSCIIKERERMRKRKKGRDSALAYSMSIQLKYQAGAVWKVSLKCSCFQALSCMWTAKLPKKAYVHPFIHSVIPWVFIECLPCARHNSELIGYREECDRKSHWQYIRIARCRQTTNKWKWMHKTNSERDWC